MKEKFLCPDCGHSRFTMQVADRRVYWHCARAGCNFSDGI